jgi:hypothetical protein
VGQRGNAGHSSITLSLSCATAALVGELEHRHFEVVDHGTLATDDVDSRPVTGSSCTSGPKSARETRPASSAPAISATQKSHGC